MGSFGPSHINQKTNEVYGTDFPVITINDIVNAQINLLDHFGIEKTFFCCWRFNGWNASFTIC
jgi:homoserine O-acetyltransferase